MHTPAATMHTVDPDKSYRSHHRGPFQDALRKRWLLLSAFCAALAGCGFGSDGPAGARLLAPSGAVSAALSDDGLQQLVGTQERGPLLWRSDPALDAERPAALEEDPAPRYTFNHQPNKTTQLVAADFAPGASHALTADARTLYLWDTSDGAALVSWTTPAPVADLALTSGGREALVGMSDHSIVYFSLRDGYLINTFLHEGEIHSLDLAHQPGLMVTGAEDYLAKLWEISTGKLIHTIRHDNPVRLVAISPDGNRLFSASRGSHVWLYERSTGVQLELTRRNPGMTVARFSADGNLLLTGTINRLIDLWDANDGSHLHRWILPPRNAWRPTGANILDVAFDQGAKDRFHALAGDGRHFQLHR